MSGVNHLLAEWKRLAHRQERDTQMRRLVVVAAIFAMALPATATNPPDCVVAFTAPTTATYYVQLGEGVRLYDLDAAETVTFWESTEGRSWAVWYAIIINDDETLAANFRAVPGELVTQGVYVCPTPPAPVIDDRDMVVHHPIYPDYQAPAAPSSAAWVYPL